MAVARSIDAKLLTGKSLEVRISSDDDVLAIGGARDVTFLLAAETLAAYLRETYRTAWEPVPRELRRARSGLILIGASASFRLKRRERLAYFEVAPAVVRDVLEQANRDPGEVARWSGAPPKGTRGRARKHSNKSAGIVAIVQSLAVSGPWGWTPAQVAKCAHCSIGFFYRFLRENEDIRRLWRDYQSEGRGKGPVSVGDV
jgi:hypothetical protein